MAVERKRKCGYRTVGGLYLVADGVGRPCDRLPFELGTCPTCGAGFKPSRSFTWIRNPIGLFGPDHGIAVDCSCERAVRCPACRPTDEPMGLLWLGAAHYTPESWLDEATMMGVSRRIAAIPKGLKLGETWVAMAARPNAGTVVELEGEVIASPPTPARIFSLFQPRAIEVIITDSQEADKAVMERLHKRGLTPVVVPEDDADHNPKGYDRLQLKLELDRKLGKEKVTA